MQRASLLFSSVLLSFADTLSLPVVRNLPLNVYIEDTVSLSHPTS